MENFGFVLVSVLVIVGMILIAAIFEKRLSRDRKPFSSTHYISYTAMFACISGVLMVLDIPLFFTPGFYKLDLSEMPILICTFYLGPVAGVAGELLKVFIKLMIKGTSTAYVGDFANFLIGCTFVIPASVIYHAKPGKKSALVGMAVGTLIMTVFGSAFNAIYLIPKFAQLYGMPLEAIVAMGTAVNGAINSVTTLALFAVVPFNLVKGVVVSALTFLLYKRISPILHKGDERRSARLAGTTVGAEKPAQDGKG